jgi:hypothetical protein
VADWLGIEVAERDRDDVVARDHAALGQPPAPFGRAPVGSEDGRRACRTGSPIPSTWWFVRRLIRLIPPCRARSGRCRERSWMDSWMDWPVSR